MIKVDKLRAEGIDYMGYGNVAKYAMTDTELPIKSKAIYAYLCSYLGRGDSIYPQVKTILADLGMSKDCYYKHVKILSEQGYISKEQKIHIEESGELIFGRNEYTIVNNPQKYKDEPEQVSAQKDYHTIRMSGIKSLGYGSIPRAVMVDQRLTANAKALYAYFASFVGGGVSAFPTRETIYHHLQIRKEAYYAAYKLLVECNYLVVEQRHTEGRLSRNDYYLVQNPNVDVANNQEENTVYRKTGHGKIAQPSTLQCTDLQCTEKQDTGKSKQTIQCTDLQRTEKQRTEIQCTEKQDTYNNNSSNINSLNTNRINHSLTVEIEQTLDRVSEGDQNHERNDQFDWINGLAHHTEESTEYRHAADLAESVLIEMLKWKSIRKVKDSYIHGWKLEEQLRKNCATEAEYQSHVEGVLFRSKFEFVKASETTVIKHPAAYMRSILWDNANTLRVKYDNDRNSLYMASGSVLNQYADTYDLVLEREYYEN